jgi:hypothetical protein
MPQLIEHEELLTDAIASDDDRHAAFRQKLSDCLPEVAEEAKIALANAGITIPIFFCIPTSGESLMSIMTPAIRTTTFGKKSAKSSATSSRTGSEWIGYILNPWYVLLPMAGVRLRLSRRQASSMVVRLVPEKAIDRSPFAFQHIPALIGRARCVNGPGIRLSPINTLNFDLRVILGESQEPGYNHRIDHDRC